MASQARKTVRFKGITNAAQNTKKEEALRQLSRLVRRHLKKNFDFLQMNSIDY